MSTASATGISPGPVSREMGAPITWAREAQAWAGRAHIGHRQGAWGLRVQREARRTMVVKEPISVAALITPWN